MNQQPPETPGDPTPDATPPAADGVRDLDLGREAWMAGDVEKANAAFYRIAADAEKQPWDALRGAAEFFRAQGNRTALRMLLATMRDLREPDAEFCLWMAEWLLDDLDEPGAREWLERGLSKTEVNSPLYWQVRGAQFVMLHPEDHQRYREVTAGIFNVPPAESLPLLEELTAKHPDFWEAWYFLGTCYRRLARPLDAIRCFERVTGYFDYPNAWLELGALYGEIGQPKKALAASQKAIGHFGDNNHVAWCNAAAALLELKRLDEAEAALMKAAKTRPESKVIVTLREELARRRGKRGLFARLLGQRMSGM